MPCGENIFDLILFRDQQLVAQRLNNLWDSLIAKVGVEKDLVEQEVVIFTFERAKDGSLVFVMVLKETQATILFAPDEWRPTPLISLKPEVLKEFFDLYVIISDNTLNA